MPKKFHEQFASQFHGTGRDDTFYGTGGNDLIFGKGGNDRLIADQWGGHDWLFGGAGDDLMSARSWHARLSGGYGNDRMKLIYQDGHPVTAVVDGGDGWDVLEVTIKGNHDKKMALVSDDTLSLSDGLEVSEVEHFALKFTGGKNILHATPKAPGWHSFRGGGEFDLITVDLRWVEGDMTLSGTNGGHVGSWIRGDTFHALNITGYERIVLLLNDSATTFLGFDRAASYTIRAGGGDDHLTGWNGNDRLFGEDGNDTLNGGYGEDRLSGGNGNDILFGREHSDRLTGGRGQDHLRGGEGDDELNGGGGRDRIEGDTGTDDLTGGGGADLFLFDKGDGTDRILDFTPGSDQIHLRQSGFEKTDMILTQQTGYVEITFAGDTSADGTVIQVMNVTLAELENEANFIF